MHGASRHAQSSHGHRLSLPSATFSSRQINRAVLARQHLLDRSAESPARVVASMGGIQAQYAPSMYLALWSRTAGFRRRDLNAALEERQLVQGTLMRGTIHLVPSEDYWPLALAIRGPRRRWWEKTVRSDPRKMERAAHRLQGFLASGPRRAREIDQFLGREVARGVGIYLDLIRVPPSGTWERRRADLYDTAENWLGPPPSGLGEEQARDHLIRFYLTGFGPSSPADLAGWAGLAVPDLKQNLERMDLEHYSSEDGVPLIDLANLPLPPAAASAPVRFLPTWDAILLVHCRRAGVLSEEHRPQIFNTKLPQSVPTYMADGVVAGTWREAGGRVHLQALRPLSSGEQEQVEAEAGLVEAFYRGE